MINEPLTRLFLVLLYFLACFGLFVVIVYICSAVEARSPYPSESFSGGSNYDVRRRSQNVTVTVSRRAARMKEPP